MRTPSSGEASSSKASASASSSSSRARLALLLAFACGREPMTPFSSSIVDSGTHLREPGRITGLSPSIRPWESQVRRADRSMGPISLPSPSLTLNPAMSPRIYTFSAARSGTPFLQNLANSDRVLRNL